MPLPPALACVLNGQALRLSVDCRWVRVRKELLRGTCGGAALRGPQPDGEAATWLSGDTLDALKVRERGAARTTQRIACCIADVACGARACLGLWGRRRPAQLQP